MLWTTLAWAVGPLLTPEGERIRLDELTELVDEAEALGRAAAFAQHHVPAQGTACTAEGSSAAVRAAVFTATWGEAVQRVRERADVLAGLTDAPTLAPLRTGDRTVRLTALLDRAKRTEADQKGAATALQRRITPYARRCPTPLAPAAGWPQENPAATDDPVRWVAVWAASPGWVCGAKKATEVRVGPVILELGRACWSETSACSCEAGPVEAGAVLGAPTAGSPAATP